MGRKLGLILAVSLVAGSLVSCKHDDKNHQEYYCAKYDSKNHKRCVKWVENKRDKQAAG